MPGLAHRHGAFTMHNLRGLDRSVELSFVFPIKRLLSLASLKQQCPMGDTMTLFSY